MKQQKMWCLEYFLQHFETTQLVGTLHNKRRTYILAVHVMILVIVVLPYNDITHSPLGFVVKNVLQIILNQ